MNLNIEIPDSLAAALRAKASAEGVTAAICVRNVLEQALVRTQELAPHAKKSAYGLLAHHGPGPSAEEIDENRREMFRGFAGDLP